MIVWLLKFVLVFCSQYPLLISPIPAGTFPSDGYQEHCPPACRPCRRHGGPCCPWCHSYSAWGDSARLSANISWIASASASARLSAIQLALALSLVPVASCQLPET